MLRIHFLQQWFGLGEPAMDEAPHDVSLHCEFARLDPGVMRLPDESTILRFRHLLEDNNLSIHLLATINATLATEGLITMKVRRGAYVTEVSEQDLTEVYHLLSLLESDAAGVVALKATDAQLDELKTLHQQLEACARPGKTDRETFFEVNERFHMALLLIANNRWRDQMVADLRKVMKLNRHHSLFKTGRVEDSLAEHRTIMAALLAHDAAAATQGMKAHFQNGLEAAF